MDTEGVWANYAHFQAATQFTDSIIHSNANDVRLDHILNGIERGTAEVTADIERAVKSHARKERSRQRTRRLTEHAFMPLGTVNPEQALIWKQARMRCEEAFSTSELRLLVKSESITSVPMTGAERTRLSRIKSSLTYRAVHTAIFEYA